MVEQNQISNWLKYGSLTGLSLLSIVVFVFAIISGSNSGSGCLGSFFATIFNASPWFILIIINIIAWKNNLIGSLLTLIFGVAAIYFFNFSGPNFFLSTFIMTCSIVLLGFLLFISHFLRK